MGYLVQDELDPIFTLEYDVIHVTNKQFILINSIIFYYHRYNYIELTLQHYTLDRLAFKTLSCAI